MTLRHLLIWGVVLAALAAIAVFTVDGPIATSLQSAAAQNRAFFNPFVTVVEYVFGFPLSKFATGFAILAASLIAFAVPKWRGAARLLLFVGTTHLIARLAAGVLKNVFLRARPDDALASGGWRDQFFVDGGSSFPSGHAAHFWALFFALAVAFPRLRIPALVLAVAVSVARVAVNDHYVSDVLASASIAALISFLCALLILKRRTDA